VLSPEAKTFCCCTYTIDLSHDLTCHDRSALLQLCTQGLTEFGVTARPLHCGTVCSNSGQPVTRSKFQKAWSWSLCAAMHSVAVVTALCAHACWPMPTAYCRHAAHAIATSSASCTTWTGCDKLSKLELHFTCACTCTCSHAVYGQSFMYTVPQYSPQFGLLHLLTTTVQLQYKRQALLCRHSGQTINWRKAAATAVLSTSPNRHAFGVYTCNACATSTHILVPHRLWLFTVKQHVK
jgi:hypothetical protein